MHNFSNLLEEERIIVPLAAEGRQGVLRALSEVMAQATGLDHRDVLEAVIERERLGSTGVGDGVAIPHVRLGGLTQSIGAFARLETPADFDAIDDRPCDLVFMLLAPETEGSDHLRALAQVSRAFRQAEFRATLRSAGTVQDTAIFLLKTDRGQAA